jgi:transposase-like protein
MPAKKRRTGEQTSTQETCGSVQGQGGCGGDPWEMALAELAEQFDVHANQIAQWKSQLLEGSAGVLEDAKAAPAQELVDMKALHPKIIALALEDDSLERAQCHECHRIARNHRDSHRFSHLSGTSEHDERQSLMAHRPVAHGT